MQLTRAQKKSISGGSVLTDTAVNHDAWNAVAAAVGCGACKLQQSFSQKNKMALTTFPPGLLAPTPQQFSCMQGVQANKLESAVISTGAAFDLVADSAYSCSGVNSLAKPHDLVFLVLDVTRFADTQTRAANGNFLHVPLLGGTTANEFDVFIVNKELLAANVTIPAITEVFSDIQTLVRVFFFCLFG